MPFWPSTNWICKIGLDIPRDNGLKLFLEKEDMERLYDFEEECVEGYFRENDIALQQSTEERIKSTNERVENMSQKVEDINQKENLQSATVQVSFYFIIYPFIFFFIIVVVVVIIVITVNIL